MQADLRFPDPEFHKREASLLASRVALTERLVAWLGTRSQRFSMVVDNGVVLGKNDFLGG